jgi:hypothetical protein
MDQVHKPRDSGRYIPSSQLFTYYLDLAWNNEKWINSYEHGNENFLVVYGLANPHERLSFTELKS